MSDMPTAPEPNLNDLDTIDPGHPAGQMFDDAGNLIWDPLSGDPAPESTDG
jgi:hypothetical protein